MDIGMGYEFDEEEQLLWFAEAQLNLQKANQRSDLH